MLLGVLEVIDGRLTKYDIYEDTSIPSAWSLLILESLYPLLEKKFIIAKGF
jgi:hypothetical protein